MARQRPKPKSTPKRIRVLDRAGGWTYAVVGYDLDGKQRQRACGHQDLRRAQRELRAFEEELSSGVDPGELKTLNDVARALFRDNEAMKHRAVHSMKQRWDNWGSKEFGTRRPESISRADVKRWVVHTLRQSGIAASHIGNIHSALSAVLQHAVSLELIDFNPAKQLPKGTLPVASKRPVPPHAVGEVAALLTQRTHAMVAVAEGHCALAGMRPSEVRGLRWCDYGDHGPGLSKIELTHQASPTRGMRGLVPLKSARDEHTAARTIPIHPALEALLTWWRGEGWEAHFGRSPASDDWVLPDPRDLRLPMLAGQLAAAFRRACKANGISPKGNLHSGRRYFVSQARSRGFEGDLVRAITHGGVSSTIDGYTTWSWDVLCAAVTSVPASDVLSDAALRQSPKVSESERKPEPVGEEKGLLSGVVDLQLRLVAPVQASLFGGR